MTAGHISHGHERSPPTPSQVGCAQLGGYARCLCLR